MAQATQGMLGPFKGRLSNLVIYQLHGKTVVRTLPSVKQRPAKGQLKQNREAFARVMKCMQRLKALLHFGFAGEAQGRSAFHTALSYNLKAYKGSTDVYSGDWLQLSRGRRAGAQDLSVEASGSTHVKVRWGEPTAGLPESGHDLAIAAAVNTTTMQCTLPAPTATRSAGETTLRIPPAKSGETIAVYLVFFNSLDPLPAQPGDPVSNSQLAGRLSFE
jgi:hypothetical protein